MEDGQIADLPPAGFYLPNFLGLEEEQHILSEVHKLPPTRWTALSHRRLLSLPSPLTGTGRDTLLAAPLPAYLDDPILPRLKTLGLFVDSPHRAPNHILVNEYQPGEGIMPHEDGPAYHPITATVSLGGHTVLDIYKKNDQGEREREPTWRILQEPRSLLVTTGEMYTGTLHGIVETEVDQQLDSEHIVNWHLLGDPAAFAAGCQKRETRVSLTYRDVLKVAKVGGALKFMAKR